MSGRACIKRADWGFAEPKPDNFQELVGQHSSSFTSGNAVVIVARNFTFTEHTEMSASSTMSNTIITSVASVFGCLVICFTSQETKHLASYYKSQRGHSFDFASNLIIS